VSQDEIGHGSRGGAGGEDVAAVVDDGEMIREGSEVEIESIANAKGVESGGHGKLTTLLDFPCIGRATME
jgi:hypothetical protein